FCIPPRPYCAASFITIAGYLPPIIASTPGNAPEGENIASHFTLLERLTHKPGLTSRYRP
ncbi:hypothetical protein MJM12_27230, partial [Salmonella enterica subsp. enterica serovar Montevideo]|nr:hypothetical protein [Salmonella enterica subsp. enterica serovar Montevideo]